MEDSRLAVPSTPIDMPVDFLEAARAVGEKALPAVRRARRGAFLLPCRSVGLSGHIGKRIQAVLRLQLDLIDRLVAGVLAFLSEHAVGADVSVGRPVKFGHVGFQRVRGKLLDVDLGGRREPLRTQRVVPQRRAVHILEQRQAVLGARLVRGDERRRVLDGCRRPGQMGNARFPALNSSGQCPFSQLIAIRQKYDNLIKSTVVKIGAHKGLSIPDASRSRH